MIDLAKFKIRHPDFDEKDHIIQLALDDANNIIKQYNAQEIDSSEQIGADIALYRLVDKSDTYALDQYESSYKNVIKQLEQHYKKTQAQTAPGAAKKTVETNQSLPIFGRDKGKL